MNYKLLIIIAIVIVIVFGIIGGILYFTTTEPEAQQRVYSTKEECEGNTGVWCFINNCDYAPPGKTLEEICGKDDFKKGWAPMFDIAPD